MKKLLLSAVALVAASLHAQELSMADNLRSIPPTTSKLELKLEPKELGMFSNLSNALFKPKSPSPFPVVVLGPTCGGVKPSHIKTHAQELLGAGYGVMILDNLGPRGLQNCRGQSAVGSASTARDAYQALEALALVPEVDKTRIYFSGYSLGGVAAPMLASPQSAQIFGSSLRYRAIVSNYGGCIYPAKPGGKATRYLERDMDVPLLMLMAGNDKEFFSSDCFPLLQELKDAGKPVQWHVYEGVHHAWDQPEHRGNYSFVGSTGETNVYLYNEQAKRDASRRMMEFLEVHR